MTGEEPPRRWISSIQRRAIALVLLRAAASSTVLVVLYYVLPLGRFRGAVSIVLVLAALMGVIVIFLWQLRAILRSERPGMRAVGALSMIVPYFLITFAAMYYLLELHIPGSFSQTLSRTDALYFTVTTFSTVGYGDITPVTDPARIAVMFQMVSDLAIIGFGAKILVEAVQLRRQDVTGGDVPSSGPPRRR